MAQEEANPPVGGPFWQLVPPGEVDAAFRLPEAMIFVGREECDITVKARSVDKRHAVIMYDYCDKRFKVKDLNSTNGTFVNEVRIPVQTYIQLDSMDMLRFGFDSAAFQVVRVPGPGEIMTVPLVQQQQQNGFREETSSNSRPSTPQEAASIPTIREERAASEEPAVVRAAVARNLSAPPELVAAVSTSSLHSAFSEDSLLGDVTKPAGEANKEESRKVAPPATLAPAVTEPQPEVPSPPSVTTPLSPVPELPPTPQQTTPSPSESTSISSSSGTTGGEDSSASSSAALPPPQPPQLHPMAFTVDFTDLGGSKRLDIGDSISKFVPRHRRNLSVSRQEEAKQQRQEKLQQQESAAEQQRGKQPQSPTSRQPQQAPSPTLARHPPAPSQSPTPRHNPSQSPNNSRHNAVTPPSRPNAAAAAPTQSPTSRQAPPVAQLQMRRAGYHSEGYFSSDQEEDLSTKSDLSVRKAKGLEKGPGRTTNLAQEKRTKPEPLPLANPEVSRPSGLMDRRSASLEESASEHFSRILGETTSPVRRQASCGTQDEGSCRSHQCQASSPQSTEVQPDSEDNVSEAGTYTIDKESPSPEEKRARNEIDVVFGVQDVPTSPMCDTRTFTRPVKVADTNGLPAPSPKHRDEPVKTASYRGGPNWIKEWAAQVAEQQRDLESVQLPSRGRVSPGGRGAPTSPLLSPVMGWPPPSQQQQPQQPMEPAGLRGPRHKLQQVSAASPVLSDHSDPTESPARRRPIQLQPDTETESYLRTTESVVTAMQARVTAAEEGPSAEELSAQLRARLRVLEHKASSVPPPQPAPGPVRKLAARTQPRVSGEGQSDSSSEAGDKPPRSRADSAGPHTSLRRARLEAEEAERNRAAKPVSAPISARGPPRLAQQAAQRPRKLEPARPTNSTPSNTKPPMHASASSGNFSRADGGRFSLRAGKVANQAPVIPKVQRPAANPARTPLSSGNKKSSSSSARSNSSLHAREVEFQNWKRRKSYDPMKAAAEGKKKAEAARKTGGQAQQQANVMTQSAIVPNTNSSPHSSPLNSILRSASFHGTGGVARQMLRHQHGSSAATSEDEATLSAEEDEDEVMVVHQFSSPASGSPRHARPSPLPPPLRCTSQPPDPGLPRKSSLDETLEGSNSRGFTRNTTPTSSVRSRGKLEALDNLVIAAIHGFSNKIKGSSHNVLSKLRVLFQEDPEKASMLEETLALLEEGEPPTSSPSKSPSKELSGTLRNLKKLEHVFTVLDEVLFGDEEILDDEDEDLEVEEEEEELSDLEADQLQAI